MTVVPEGSGASTTATDRTGRRAMPGSRARGTQSSSVCGAGVSNTGSRNAGLIIHKNKFPQSYGFFVVFAGMGCGIAKTAPAACRKHLSAAGLRDAGSDPRSARPSVRSLSSVAALAASVPLASAGSVADATIPKKALIFWVFCPVMLASRRNLRRKAERGRDYFGPRFAVLRCQAVPTEKLLVFPGKCATFRNK